MKGLNIAILKLKEQHPAFQALNRVFECMATEGITINNSRYGTTVTYEGKEYWLMDLESSDRHMGAINQFPSEMEFKLIKDSE